MKNFTLTFPRDSQSHGAIVEWWYFNGHLWDKDGKLYSFMDCLFKVNARKCRIPYVKQFPGRNFHFAHSVLCDINAKKNHKSIQHVSLVSRDSFKRPLMYANYMNPVIIGGYLNCEIEETSQHDFRLKTENFSLELRSQKEPLMEGGKGFINACGREMYYYSLTDMRATGLILINGKWIEVEGKAWMDHQWANLAFARDQWTWFSVQLKNGTDIMCAEYSGGKNKKYIVSMIHSDGTQEHFDNCIMRPGKDVWKSKKTKAEYPLSWRIEIPDKKITLDVESLMKDQEMIFGAINYWEGPLKVTASINGKKVAGHGFMELMGYPSDYNYLLQVSKKMYEKVQDIIHGTIRKLFMKHKA